LVQSPGFCSLPTDLSSCNSISEMIPLIFRMYSTECSLYKNVNHFLHCFQTEIVTEFMKELGGIMTVDVLQSSITYHSHIQPLLSNVSVSQGIKQVSKMLVPFCAIVSPDGRTGPLFVPAWSHLRRMRTT
jgi:hypothetical protein